MDDPYFMDVFDARDELMKHPDCLRLTDTFAVDNVVKEFPFFHELHDQKELFRSLNDLIKLHYIGMPD